MICTDCGTDTVVWIGDLLNPDGTQCQRCRQKNCQTVCEPMERQEGDECECGGRFAYIRQRSCSCHISPPCSACVDAPLICDACGAYANEEEE